MDLYHDELGEGVKNGFLDKLIICKEEYIPQFLVNDAKNSRKVLTTLLKELNDCTEFWLSVAFATKGGVATIINTLKELEEKGIKGKILVSQYQNFTEPEALKTLLQLTNIELRIIVKGNFHAKQYLFKKQKGYTLIIGSSNLTDKALCVNKEWNLKVCASDKSAIINQAFEEFNSEFNNAVSVTQAFIDEYEPLYIAQRSVQAQSKAIIAKLQELTIQPNSMQVDALANLLQLRTNGKTCALLISATATGKTYLSAFDVKSTGAKRCLFLVHRANIAQAALQSYRRIFGDDITMGMYAGEKREMNADFIFSTVQTISRDNHLHQFDSQHFDYIVIDETHRAGADSYQKIINHFKPKFILGMTATPERMDGFNIFKQFDYNIAYEIRLQKALEENMLCRFHYYGVTDVIVEERSIKGDVPFNLLVSEERVAKIIEKASLFGCDNGCVRGLIFCSSVKESNELSHALNQKGYKTVALSGEDSEEARSNAIQRLESDNQQEKLDYIFTVDIFNEGVDIPRVNQIILLRPTQSAIVFVQQLGRGLRKADNKKYLTVIDFIGNYSNNYLVPIALFGDTSYNKDTLRKLMTSGSSLIPGASTVNFEKIPREKIYRSIDSANLSLKKDLVKDYELLKFEIGRPPMMMDFIDHGSRDPFLYVENSKSYFNFATQQESEHQIHLPKTETTLLELFSNHIADGKRIEEVMILLMLIDHQQVTASDLKSTIEDRYDVTMSDATFDSCIRNINFEFVNKPQKVVKIKNAALQFTDEFKTSLKKNTFKEFLLDVLQYAQATYDKKFDNNHYIDGFLLYQKYSRQDVCRILNWEKDEHSTIYGYKTKYNTCPVFVNYHKEEGITETTKYSEEFISSYEFQWMSRSRRTSKSPEIIRILNAKQDNLRIPFFIKKNNDEGNDFYYMGDVEPVSFEDTFILDNTTQIPVVKINFTLSHPVETSIYDYLTQK